MLALTLYVKPYKIFFLFLTYVFKNKIFRIFNKSNINKFG